MPCCLCVRVRRAASGCKINNTEVAVSGYKATDSEVLSTALLMVAQAPAAELKRWVDAVLQEERNSMQASFCAVSARRCCSLVAC
eukprot:6176321-Pleurochrysis_carterae.AAC.1